MDLGFPLRSLIPSLDSDVLAVLAGTESSLGITQVARLTSRGSRQGIANVLDRLTEHGLVLAHPTNKGHIYQLNRDHVLARPLFGALDVRREVLSLLSRQLEQLDPLPVHASLFGSFARGEGDADSDIDVLIITPDGLDGHDEEWNSQLHHLEDVLLRATGNRLEPLVLSLDAFSEAVGNEEPIIARLKTDSRQLFGTGFSDLLARATVA
jgi:predicted nucleotidyltransferase